MTTLKGSGGSSTSLPGNRTSFFKLRRVLELGMPLGKRMETPRGITAVTVMWIIFQLKAAGFGELCAAAWIGPCGQQEKNTWDMSNAKLCRARVGHWSVLIVIKGFIKGMCSQTNRKWQYGNSINKSVCSSMQLQFSSRAQLPSYLPCPPFPWKSWSCFRVYMSTTYKSSARW